MIAGRSWQHDDSYGKGGARRNAPISAKSERHASSHQVTGKESSAFRHQI